MVSRWKTLMKCLVVISCRENLTVERRNIWWKDLYDLDLASRAGGHKDAEKVGEGERDSVHDKERVMQEAVEKWGNKVMDRFSVIEKKMGLQDGQISVLVEVVGELENYVFGDRGNACTNIHRAEPANNVSTSPQALGSGAVAPGIGVDEPEIGVDGPEDGGKTLGTVEDASVSGEEEEEDEEVLANEVHEPPKKKAKKGSKKNRGSKKSKKSKKIATPTLEITGKRKRKESQNIRTPYVAEEAT